MQTLTSSEKVYPGIDLVGAVFFLFSDSPLASLHTAEGMGWGGGKYLFPFIQGDSNHESLKITCWLHIKPGKDKDSYRLKSHNRSSV